MGGPIFVTLSEIYMVKIEENIVIPSKPIFTEGLWVTFIVEGK